MSEIFWGFVFAFLNFNLTVNSHTLNFLPPFVFLLLLRGMRTMEGENVKFHHP